jgi:hypothetical protein
MMDLATILAGLFPSPSTARYARYLGMRQRSLQRFLDGERAFVPTPAQTEAFARQADALKASGLPGKLQAVVTDAERAGVHPEIAAAWIAAAYRAAVGRAVE